MSTITQQVNSSFSGLIFNDRSELLIENIAEYKCVLQMTRTGCRLYEICSLTPLKLSTVLVDSGNYTFIDSVRQSRLIVYDNGNFYHRLHS